MQIGLRSLHCRQSAFGGKSSRPISQYLSTAKQLPNFRSRSQPLSSCGQALAFGSHRTAGKRNNVVASAKRGEETAEVVPVSDVARRALQSAANSTGQTGWFSFWLQLALSIVSAVILLFSVAFTSQNGPGVSLYLTLFGVIASFLSTFWAYGLTRLSKKLRGYAQAGPQADIPRIKKKDVLRNLERGCWINIAGMVSTLLGLQATVGLLVAKTLTNATANPFLSGGAGSYNPVLALDVFQVQASTNTLLSHFASLLCSLWLIRILGRNATTPSGGMVPKTS